MAKRKMRSRQPKESSKNAKEQLAVLDFNNISTEGLNISPAQIMFGRRCRTRMIIQKENLIPRHNLKDMEKQIKNKLDKQKM